MDNPHLLPPELMIDLKRLELRSKRSVDSDLMGQYRSSFKGTGLLFSDLRAYEPGDDIKHIHWKVTARAGRPFVKTYQEERQLRIILALDISASTMWGAPKSKHARALEFAALLTMLAQQNNDTVGLCLFDQEVVEFIKPSSKRSHFQRILRALMDNRSLKPATNVGGALEFIRERSMRSSVIFIISDFITPNFEKSLAALSSKNDVIGVSLLHTEEDILPAAGLVELQDSESGECVLVDTSSQKTRAGLKRSISEMVTNARMQFQRSQGDFIEIQSNPIRPLLDLMRQRSRRAR